MTHRARFTFAALILGVAGLILAASVPAAGQGTVPITATWEALPGIVPEGATVVVRTLDGSRGGRPVRRGARIGATIGIWMAATAAYAALEQSVSSEPCAADECVRF